MTIVDSVIQRLGTLARRVRTHDADLRPAAGVLADAVRLAAWGSSSELRSTQPALGALHESLAGNPNGRSLSGALADDHAREFLMGAVWAISEIFTARLNTLDAEVSAPMRQSKKAKFEQALLNELRVDVPQTPGELIEKALKQGVSMKQFEASRALANLLALNHVKAVEAPNSSDRRHRYFVLTDEGNMRVRTGSSDQATTQSPLGARRRNDRSTD